jgi:hypothetical protein
MLTPPLRKWETFPSTHFSADFMLVAMGYSKSLGMPTMTSSPLFLSAFMVSSSASNSFTFWNPFSLSIRTTVSGDSGWLACVPQFAPIALTPVGAKHSQETRATATAAAPWPDQEPMKRLFQLQAPSIELCSKIESGSSDLGNGQEQSSRNSSRNSILQLLWPQEKTEIFTGKR